MLIKKILSILFLLVLPSVYGVGIGLFVEETNFEPNLNRNFDAFINNNMGYDAKVRLNAIGGLAEYISFSDEYLDIPAGGRTFFTFNLKLPETIPPGRNRINIGAEDITPAAGGGISSRTAAYIGFYVRAPYPGKYIDASFRAGDIGENATAEFNIDIISRGTEAINKIDGMIEIFNQGSKVDIVSLDKITDIQPGESRTIQAKWDSKGQPVGEYSAKATINYDNKQLTLDTGFKIGTLLVKIISYTREFYQDEINKFEVEIQSFWSGQIDDVYGEIGIDEQKIKSSKTNLAGWGKTRITAYWDATGAYLGEHTADINVYYANKVAEETGKIIVLPKKERIIELPSKISPMTVLLIGMIILLLVGNAILVLYFIKKMRNTGKAGKLKRK